MKEMRYTEIFRSLQGEGMYTGANTVWLRFFQCNLECRGFGQPEPANPATYFDVGQTIDISDITHLDDVPVHEYGCDSAYSVAKQYRHLAYKNTPIEVADKLVDLMRNDNNPEGKFVNPMSKMDTHMAFTGGEPMMNQAAIMSIMDHFAAIDNVPENVTIETNGTRAIREFAHLPTSVFWSVSPKLLHVSGEESKKAIKPEVLEQYAKIADHGQLKFVLNNDQQSWIELYNAISLYRDAGIEWPVYIMPVGGLKEQQESEQTMAVVQRALDEGYHVSGRLHTYIFGNAHNT